MMLGSKPIPIDERHDPYEEKRCARCGHEEFRIHGYCSIYCQDMDELERECVSLEAELDKWKNWKPDDETLLALQEQAKASDGTYTNGLAAQACYIGGLEYRQKELETSRDEWRRKYEALDALAEACIKEKKPGIYQCMICHRVWANDRPERHSEGCALAAYREETK
jgi:hypothetical protein